MTAQVTHWLEYGEPTGNDQVEAIHRVTYITGPNERREDDVAVGTLSYEGLELGFGENNSAEHVHDDGSLELSALDDEKRDKIMAEFEPAEIEYESEIEPNHENSEYDREARGKLVVEGPKGKLVALKRYRAMLEEDNGLMETGQIQEYTRYYREGENECFTDQSHIWHPRDGRIEDKDKFEKECLASLEADPKVEYAQFNDDL